jgi:2-oxoisovalerate dehydrogenase E1 component
MRARPEIVLLGQDIAEYGGVFKATEGFVQEFGKARVRNTPIIESGAIGAAMGLALDGFRPMVEMQFGDFITCGFNQIVNNLAKTQRPGSPTSRASRSWRRPPRTTRRACWSPRSRTGTPCSTSSTSCSTAR